MVDSYSMADIYDGLIRLDYAMVWGDKFCKSCRYNTRQISRLTLGPCHHCEISSRKYYDLGML